MQWLLPPLQSYCCCPLHCIYYNACLTVATNRHKSFPKAIRIHVSHILNLYVAKRATETTTAILAYCTFFSIPLLLSFYFFVFNFFSPSSSSLMRNLLLVPLLLSFLSERRHESRLYDKLQLISEGEKNDSIQFFAATAAAVCRWLIQYVWCVHSSFYSYSRRKVSEKK